MRESVTDLPDVARLPTRGASDRSVNHAWFLFLSAHLEVFRAFAAVISAGSILII